MKVSIEFEEGDFASLHDTIFDLFGKELTHDELKLVWDKLPSHIKDDGIRWGIDDSVVRDYIYDYLQKNGL